MSDRDDIRGWFVREVLPHEPALMAYFSRNWRNPEDVLEFRQDVYAKLIVAAREVKPSNVRAYLLAIARNHLINHVHRARIISFDLLADIEELSIPSDEVTPERVALARDELRQVRAAVGQLPPRCQEVFLLRKVEGLSIREISDRVGISPKTVENHLTHAIRGLAAILHSSGLEQALAEGNASDTRAFR